VSERFPRVASLRSAAALRARLTELGLDLPVAEDEAGDRPSPLESPLDLGDGPAGRLRPANRFVVQPMEGWDGTPDGRPSPLTERRWERFGASGAGWIWGGEAVAVSSEARANPRQLMIDAGTAPALARLRERLLEAARQAGFPAPVVGLQLTHSGRWSVPEPGRRRPRVAYRHPLLDRRVGIVDDGAVLRDAEVDGLVGAFARAAALAEGAGFDFVDVKHCHGYLLHEFLSARTRPGPWGGAGLAERARLAETIVAAVRQAAPSLRVGVRLSLFDAVPHRRADSSAAAAPAGEPESHALPYLHGFGVDPGAPSRIDLAEPVELVRRLATRGVAWINATAASPYYAPHLQRPALFPPLDGYPPPEDPLVGVARLLQAARALKAAVPEVRVVSSGWTYLQEWIAPVACACLRDGWFDAVGLGRMALAYPDLPAALLARRPPARSRLCRTFSDCTSAPRSGLVSGCFPLDPFYRARPERRDLEAAKRARRQVVS
jgi:2,4-dienoyl-CoA reductase-like NADH-dependent reductase (Old Yellow Enzyme family)